jgi:hypothetical protein
VAAGSGVVRILDPSGLVTGERTDFDDLATPTGTTSHDVRSAASDCAQNGSLSQNLIQTSPVIEGSTNICSTIASYWTVKLTPTFSAGETTSTK